MKAIPVSVLVLAFAAGWAAPAMAQTAPTSPTATEKKIPLRPLKVQSAHASAVHNRPGSHPGKRSTVEYEENLMSTAQFGSRHWWAIHERQFGGASPP